LNYVGYNQIEEQPLNGTDICLAVAEYDQEQQDDASSSRNFTEEIEGIQF